MRERPIIIGLIHQGIASKNLSRYGFLWIRWLVVSAVYFLMLSTNSFIGSPQLGHSSAFVLIPFPHSGHLISAICLLFYSRLGEDYNIVKKRNRPSYFTIDVRSRLPLTKMKVLWIVPQRSYIKCSYTNQRKHSFLLYPFVKLWVVEIHINQIKRNALSNGKRISPRLQVQRYAFFLNWQKKDCRSQSSNLGNRLLLLTSQHSTWFETLSLAVEP